MNGIDFIRDMIRKPSLLRSPLVQIVFPLRNIKMTTELDVDFKVAEHSMTPDIPKLLNDMPFSPVTPA